VCVYVWLFFLLSSLNWGNTQSARAPKSIREKHNLSFPWQIVTPYHMGPEIKQEDPLNLSILLGGGKETNKDSLSNGE